jgi:hypothetical protein
MQIPQWLSVSVDSLLAVFSSLETTWAVSSSAKLIAFSALICKYLQFSPNLQQPATLCTTSFN